MTADADVPAGWAARVGADVAAAAGEVASLLPGAAAVALDDHMWASKVLALRDAMPAADQRPGGEVLRELRRFLARSSN